MKDRILTILNYLMAIIFIFAVVVQFNDPDFIQWMFMYGSASVACILYATGKYKRAVPAIILVVAFIWMAFIFPEFFEGESFSFQTFNSVRMTNMEFETAREFGGLAVIAIWMGLITAMPPSSGNRTYRR